MYFRHPSIYVVGTRESYAGTYRLEYLSNGWAMLYRHGRPVGAIADSFHNRCTSTAATFFRV